MEIVVHFFISRHQSVLVLLYLTGTSFSASFHVFSFIILLTFKYWHAIGVALTLLILSRYPVTLVILSSSVILNAIYTLKTPDLYLYLHLYYSVLIKIHQIMIYRVLFNSWHLARFTDIVLFVQDRSPTYQTSGHYLYVTQSFSCSAVAFCGNMKYII